MFLPTIGHFLATSTPECLVPFITHSAWQHNNSAVGRLGAVFGPYFCRSTACHQSHQILYLLSSLCLARIIGANRIGPDVDEGVVYDMEPRHWGKQDLCCGGAALSTLSVGSCTAGWLMLHYDRLNGGKEGLHICSIRSASRVRSGDQTLRDSMAVLQLPPFALELEADVAGSHEGG